MFSWIVELKKSFVPATFFLKRWIVIMLYFIAIIVPFTIANEFINNQAINQIIEFVMFYIITLMISFRAIRAQEELLIIREQQSEQRQDKTGDKTGDGSAS